MLTIATVALSVCLSVYLPVTLVHPAKAIGWTKMQYGGDTGVTPSNILQSNTSYHVYTVSQKKSHFVYCPYL